MNDMMKGLREIESRLHRLDAIETALRSVDHLDWEYIESALGDGGRDRSWKEVLRDLRYALRD